MSNVFDRMSASSEESHRETDPVQSYELIGEDSFGEKSASTEDSNTRTSLETRTAVQELLKSGYLEEGARREIFRNIIVHSVSINRILEPLDLELRIDTHRGIAFLVIRQEVEETNTENDAWAHPLVRKQRLTLEQSLLIAVLRQSFIRHEQESGVGQNDAKTSVEEILPHYITYFGDTGSDSKNESKLLHLLDQLKTYGIVTEVDAKQELVIRPLIAHLANPESLATLLKVLQAKKQEMLAGDLNEEGDGK